MGSKKIKIIAEIASNHQGDMELAKEFIKVGAECGVDVVKFQSSRYEDLVDKNDVQSDWVKTTSLTDEQHFELIDECKKYGVEFLTTCFSISRVPFLASLGIKEIKIASPDLLSYSMIEQLAERFEHLIISVGMHNLKEIKESIQFLEKNKINATLLHAVSLYPTPIEDTFMSKFLWLRDNYSKVGYSNHHPELTPMIFALSNGASIVESHMKLGEDGPGRATKFDILPGDFKALVNYKKDLLKMLSHEADLANENFLFPEEVKARERFIGRWGNNK